MAEHPLAARDNWDVHWSQYAAAATQNPAQAMRHTIIERLLSEDRSSARMRVLDLGSGQGDLARKIKLALPEAEFIGFDLSETAVAIARRNVPAAIFLMADILRPPAELEEKFAGWGTHAVCCEVLEHLDDPVSFLKRATSYLASGARIIVTVPSGPVSAFDRQIGHRQHFNRAKIRATLQEAGYCVDRTYLAGFPFFNLYRLVVIARGKRLTRDIESSGGRKPSKLAGIVMKLFAFLFRANLPDSPFGWQVVATARKGSG